MNTKLAIQCGELISKAYLEKSIKSSEGLYAKPAGIDAPIEKFGSITKTDIGIVIALAGTTTIHDWESNANLRTIPYIIDGCEITEGVVDLAIQIESQILKTMQVNLPVYIAGHSLGAAIAETIYLRNQRLFAACYSFAAPKSRTVGLTPFQLYRIFNTKDVVPELPPFMKLTHSGIDIPLTFDHGNIIDNHKIDNYVTALTANY